MANPNNMNNANAAAIKILNMIKVIFTPMLQDIFDMNPGPRIQSLNAFAKRDG
jgi:hypothetical protein